MMCVMALFVNLLVVGCFALVYGTKMKYENGMLFWDSYAKRSAAGSGSEDIDGALYHPDETDLLVEYGWSGDLRGCWHLHIRPYLCLAGCSGCLRLPLEVWDVSADTTESCTILR